jgi:predicted TIM-barrel fold metal-dependent hydrolase
MNGDLSKTIDMHCHVGLLGDEHPQWGRLSEWYRKQITYRTFLLYGRIKENAVCDRTLREATEKALSECSLDHVVCLALDPVYDSAGIRDESRSHVWVDNDYVLDLRRTVGDKVLLGASVHPYDAEFENRVKKYVDSGAVLLKWLPSAQQINLADSRVRDRLEFLATAGPNGRPLPLLLHVGPEYAIPSSDPRTHTYDWLGWTFWDKIGNFFRFGKRWHTPDLDGVHANIRAGLDAGATIIFAHCGLPYFAGAGPLGRLLEHSDLKAVRRYLEGHHPGAERTGTAYADVSACATPFRRTYFKQIKQLPADSLLFGSDFPTPVFELSADLNEVWNDFKAVMAGQLDRVLVPQDNLLDVNYRELSKAFPGHAMFENPAKLFGLGG